MFTPKSDESIPYCHIVSFKTDLILFFYVGLRQNPLSVQSFRLKYDVTFSFRFNSFLYFILLCSWPKTRFKRPSHVYIITVYRVQKIQVLFYSSLIILISSGSLFVFSIAPKH
jgi:hypothetical protein